METVILLLSEGHWEIRCCYSSFTLSLVYIHCHWSLLVEVAPELTAILHPARSSPLLWVMNKNVHSPWKQVLAPTLGHPWKNVQVMKDTHRFQSGLMGSSFLISISYRCTCLTPFPTFQSDWHIMVSGSTQNQRHQHCRGSPSSSHHCIRSKPYHKTPTLYHS